MDKYKPIHYVTKDFIKQTGVKPPQFYDASLLDQHLRSASGIF